MINYYYFSIFFNEFSTFVTWKSDVLDYINTAIKKTPNLPTTGTLSKSTLYVCCWSSHYFSYISFVIVFCFPSANQATVLQI